MAGKLVHFEIPARDTGRAMGFWSGVLGWEFGESAMPELPYHMVRTGDDQGGAVMSSEGPFGLVVYFDTDDIDASIAKVREHGGTADDKMPIPNVGWFTHCTDTEGNAFSLFQSDESVTG
jgi:predicted enzyme related to lactoylglutathione lyase